MAENQEQQQPAQPEARAPPAPRQPAQRQPAYANRIPAMQNAANLIAFGRLDSDYQVVDLTAQVENQNALATAVYRQIESIVSIDLTITLAQFIRMWKTLYLKRLQDVFEAEKHQRHANFVRVGRQVPLPGPLADLMHAVGFHHSHADGHMYHVVPPAAPAQPEAWRAIDQGILNLWTRELSRASPLYTIKEFPAMNQCADRPLCLTLKHEVNNLAHIKAWTNEPAPTDAYIRAVNDDLFAAHAFINFDNASLTMTHQLDVTTLRAQYAGSYVINANS